MLMDGLDGRLLVISLSEPRYALHTAVLRDGRRLDVKEDIWQTVEYRSIAASQGEVVPIGPRYHVTKVTSQSGQEIKPAQTNLPLSFRLTNGLVIDNYVCHEPSDN